MILALGSFKVVILNMLLSVAFVVLEAVVDINSDIVLPMVGTFDAKRSAMVTCESLEKWKRSARPSTRPFI